MTTELILMLVALGIGMIWVVHQAWTSWGEKKAVIILFVSLIALAILLISNK